MIPLGISLVIFDLDDTLYPEIDFVMSGFRAVSKQFAATEEAASRLFARMQEIFSFNKRKVFDTLIEEPDMVELLRSDALGSAGTAAAITSLALRMVDCYRNHEPRISLYPDVSETLDELARRQIHLALLTDGEASMQARKIRALGLERLLEFIVYTDALGPGRQYWKPSVVPFRIVLEHFGVTPSSACYVADNPIKDFVGPNRLGIFTVRILRENGFYSKAELKSDATYTINELRELLLLPLFSQ